MSPEEIARYNKMMYMRAYRAKKKIEKEMLVSKEDDAKSISFK